MPLASEVRRPAVLPPKEGAINPLASFYATLWHPFPLKTKDPTGSILTNNGATWTLLNNGLYVPLFDGVDDFISAPDNASLALGVADFTLLAWFKTGQASDYNIGLIQKLNYASGYFGFGMDVHNQYLSLSLGNGAGAILNYNASVTPVNDNAWRLGGISVVRGGLASFYLQGSLEGTSSVAGNSATLTNAHVPWIGKSDHFNKKYAGYLGMICVVKGLALSAAGHKQVHLMTKWRYGY